MNQRILAIILTSGLSNGLIFTPQFFQTSLVQVSAIKQVDNNKQSQSVDDSLTIITPQFTKDTDYKSANFRHLLIADLFDDYKEKSISFTSIFWDFGKDNIPRCCVEVTGIPIKNNLFLRLSDSLYSAQYSTLGKNTYIAISRQYIKSLTSYNQMDLVEIQGKAKVYDNRNRLEEIRRLRLELEQKKNRGQINSFEYEQNKYFLYFQEVDASRDVKFLYVEVHKMRRIRKG